MTVLVLVGSRVIGERGRLDHVSGTVSDAGLDCHSARRRGTLDL